MTRERQTINRETTADKTEQDEYQALVARRAVHTKQNYPTQTGIAV